MSAISFEIKANLQMLPCIRLLSDDLEKFKLDLQQQIAKSPQFFFQAPMMIDLTGIDERNNVDFFRALVEALEKNHLKFVGFKTHHVADRQLLQKFGFVVFFGGERPTAEPAEAEAEKPKPAKAAKNNYNKLITAPIRSGQQIYAKGGDLIILSAVSAGAEVLADGNIHIYGSLRGRALAGVNGDTTARIFCQQFEPELIAIAGVYMISERIPQELQKKNLQIFLEENKLQFKPLENI